ncbi:MULTISPECIES: hypothetical protein [unclassified Rathayibacter]|uniref:hypothetical protein n=1 Tax=unclassified Rathayibacter TaxID=2609250 RepID=UPI000CE7FAA1|nr:MULTISPECIES: hypothetical protein [unclassified Rathayibacter]PPF26492.1 hypothetical protein C5C54_12855 [Rathayibacter sp. AY1F2]PPH46154.1 hypothetical protein C5C42_07610 [Rathayibacter sp. AY1F7]
MGGQDEDRLIGCCATIPSLKSRDERRAEFERREADRKARYEQAKTARAEKWAARVKRPAPAAPATSAAPVAEPTPFVTSTPTLPAKGERLSDEQITELRRRGAVLRAASDGIAGVFNQPTVRESREALHGLKLVAAGLRLRAIEQPQPE